MKSLELNSTNPQGRAGGRRQRSLLLGACCVVAASFAVSALGCKTPFYRKQADADANYLMDQKSAAVCLEPGTFRININPQSRMADPYNPDCEPMPPDDPTAHRYMECVDCKKGSKCWKCLPKTPFVDNPDWQAYLPRNARGEVELDTEGAVRLALLESPSYQSQLENLYLSALDVSFERFRFDTQFFGGSRIFYTADGRDRSGTGNSTSTFEVSPLAPDNRLRFSRLNATGGTLVAGMANSLVWQFAGPDNYSSNTLLDFSLVQPLLRGAGRVRVLERLTISERALLGNVRSMERYRRGFYVNVVTGRGNVQGPSRRGGFFGGAGLEGFAGVGGGGFGGVGFFGGGGFGNNGGQGITGGAGAAGAGGYLGLLQSAQQIRNQRANVAALRDSVEQLQETYEAGRIDRFQVDLARQALYNAQSQLLTAENQYAGSLDEFKVGTLGLAPEVPVKISDDVLDQFNLLDPKLEVVQTRVSAVLTALRELRSEMAEQQQPGAGVPAPPDLEAQLEPLLAGALDVESAISERLADVATDLDELDAALPARREQLAALAGRPEVRAARLSPELFDADALEGRAKSRREEYLRLNERLTAEWNRIDDLADRPDLTAAEVLTPLIETLNNVSGQLLEAALLQAGARLDSITFDPVDLTSEEALNIAAAFRRDWKNARMQLVDTWRLIYFNANDLKAGLNIVFSGDIGNVGDNPFRLRDTRGRLRAGLEFDAPLTRLAERNVYRQSLIEYQQARRSYYQFRDRIAQGLRNTLRQVRLNEINFELRRAAVLVAISQVDLTQLRLSEPPKPGEEQILSNTTARDLVQSLSDLLNVQNDFLSVWVNFEVQRLNLELDLGVMELDPSGVRVENSMSLREYLACPEVAEVRRCYPSDFVAAVAGVDEEGLGLPEFEGPIEGLEADLAPPPEDAGNTPLINPAGEPLLSPPGVVPEAEPLPEPGARLLPRLKIRQESRRLQNETIEAAAALIDWPIEQTPVGERIVLPLSVRPLPPVEK
ncbi:MAG: TolC family protein [Planctomycetales bacterium]|nr:TolC family protein [Planctomycetales bacterium]